MDTNPIKNDQRETRKDNLMKTSIMFCESNISTTLDNFSWKNFIYLFVVYNVNQMENPWKINVIYWKINKLW